MLTAPMPISKSFTWIFDGSQNAGGFDSLSIPLPRKPSFPRKASFPASAAPLAGIHAE
jgi:hypothetical protein